LKYQAQTAFFKDRVRTAL